jgi:hypothetical protein
LAKQENEEAMHRKKWWLLAVACVAVALAAGPTRAEDTCPDCAPTIHRYGRTTEADHTLERAGHPELVACCAIPLDAPSYVGYPVGGGAAWHGNPPHSTDGTWGWDYQGCVFKRRVFLFWWYGQRYQGGTGAYKVDGPHFVHEQR